MKPSRQRSTTGARTVPRSVTTAPGAIARRPGALVDAYAALPHDAGDAASPAGPGARGRSRGRSARTRRRPPGPGRPPARRSSSPASRCGLRLRAGDVRTPLRTMSASMPSAGGHADDLVDRGRAARPAGAATPSSPATCGVRPRAAGELARQPAAVAPRRAEAGELRLDDADVEGRVAPREVVRRPEPGEPAADDRPRRSDVSPWSRSVGEGSPTCCHQKDTPPLRTPPLWLARTRSGARSPF